MAKPSTFFIRKTEGIGNTNTFHETEIDLGAYVNALAKTVLIIRSIETTYSDATGRSNVVIANLQAVAQFQVTTQSQDDLILPSDKSMISSGRISIVNMTGANAVGGIVSEALDHSPQMYAEGFLVGTDSIYLGGAASPGFFDDVHITVVLECEVGTMSSEKAMALALSQQ